MLSLSSLAPAQVNWGWVSRNVLQKIEVSGRRSFGYHSHQIDGDKEAFQSLTYSGYGGQKFTDIGFMDVQGHSVLGALNFRLQIANNRYTDPQAKQTSINYGHKPVQVDLGDVQGTLLNSNRFASFSKLMRGGSVRLDLGRLKAKTLYTEARGAARTVSIQGNNSSGPYYLQTSQIVRGSESVELDGQRMRLGLDYVINYELGAITFVDRLVTPTSTIVVSFESLGFNASSSGVIRGAGATYDFGKFGRIGLTALEQNSRSGSGLSTRVELFQGSGAPSTPYFLQFAPLLSRPIIVKLDGVLQTEGVDYRFDPVNPTIFFFLRFVSFESTIEVVYTPQPTQTVDGDRRVIGVDYRINFGGQNRGGNIGYSQATGELISDVNPLKGTARGVDGLYRFDKLEFRGAYRDVPSTFVSVETRGFNRNERAMEVGAKYAKGPFAIDLSNTNSNVALRQVHSNGSVTFQRVKTTALVGTSTYRREVGQPWTLDFSRRTSGNGAAQTSLSTETLSTGRTFGRLISHIAVENQNGRGPLSTGSTTTVGDLSLQTLRLESTYTAGKAWAFGAKSSVSLIDAAGKTGRGTDQTLSANFQPTRRFSITSSMIDSHSGQLATLGQFQSGLGLGYGGNGFSGGTGGLGFSTGATDRRVFQVSSRYEASDRLLFNASVVKSKTAGSITSNSETTAATFSVDAALDRHHTISTALSQSRTTFVGSTTDSEALTWGGSLTGSPEGRVSYSLDVNTLVSGGNSPTKQSSFGFDASLAYRLKGRERLVFTVGSGRSSGYLPQDQSSAGVAYQYQLYKNVGLSAGYTVRRVQNLSGSNVGGAYRARSFDLELTFGFWR